jgi:glycosyltransferase involved in cell wall biosynthesis
VGAYFPEWDETRVVYMSETGVDDVADRVERPLRSVPRVLFVGRLVPSKGAHLLLSALARVKASAPFEATLVGEGFLRPQLEARTRELGLADCVRFTGRIPREQVFRLYEESDVFAFPSLEEASGNVVFEAMSRGLPTIAADAGGPAAVLDASLGALVPAREHEAFVAEFARQLERFLRDPELRRRCGDAARAEVERRHVWPRKIDALAGVYAALLAQ